MKLTVDCVLKISDLATSEHVPSLQGLSFLLSRARKVVHQKNALDDVVSQAFGLHATPDYPMAAISAFGDGQDVQNAVWFYADPVHFLLQRDTFSLHDDAPLKLSASDADNLLSALNQHFSEDGLHFLRGYSGDWFIKIPENTAIFWPVKTSAVQSAIGQDVQVVMPKGETALQWRKLLNEIQMLLHEHAINQAREKNGQLTVSSIWVSGGGVLPLEPDCHVQEDVLLADHPFYAGVACLAQKKHLALQQIEVVINQKKYDAVRVRLESKDLVQPMISASSWWSFFVECLKKRNINQLVLNVGLHDTTLTAEISLFDLFKFWRKTKPLADFFVGKKA